MAMKKECKWESRWIWFMMCLQEGFRDSQHMEPRGYLVTVNKGVEMDVLLSVCSEIQPLIK